MMMNSELVDHQEDGFVKAEAYRSRKLFFKTNNIVDLCITIILPCKIDD